MLRLGGNLGAPHPCDQLPEEPTLEFSPLADDTHIMGEPFTIILTAKQNGEPLVGETITLSSSEGILNIGSGVTDENGQIQFKK